MRSKLCPHIKDGVLRFFKIKRVFLWNKNGCCCALWMQRSPTSFLQILTGKIGNVQFLEKRFHFSEAFWLYGSWIQITCWPQGWVERCLQFFGVVGRGKCQSLLTLWDRTSYETEEAHFHFKGSSETWHQQASLLHLLTIHSCVLTHVRTIWSFHVHRYA